MAYIIISSRKWNQILLTLSKLLDQQEHIMAAIDDLEASTTTIINLLTEIHTDLLDALANPSDLEPRIQAVVQKINDAVAANPDPTPEPTEPPVS